MGKTKNPFYKESFGERPVYVERINGMDSLVENSNHYLQKFSGYTQTDILEKILIKSGSNSTHSLNIQYSNSSDIPRYDRLTDPAGTGLKYAEWYYGPQQRLLVAYDYKLKYRLGLDHIRIGGNYQNILESRFTRKFDNNNLDAREEKVQIFGLNLDALKSWSRNELRFGAEAQFNSLQSTAYSNDILTNTHSPLDTRYPDGDNVMNSIAAYFSHRLTFHEKWTLNDGIRLGYSYLHSTFADTSFYQFPFSSITQQNTVLSGAAGLVFMPAQPWRLAVNLSSGFRVPNVDDLAKVFESAPGLVVVPNPDLLPERSYNADLSVDYKFTNFIKWENAFFITSFRNIITTDDFSWNGQDSILYDGEMSKVVANQNKQKAWITGFSSTLLAEPLPWYYGAAITYTYGRVLEDGVYGPLDHIPPFFGKVYLGFRKEKWDAQFFTLFNAWKPLKDYRLGAEDNEAYATEKGTPAWFTLNVRCSYEINKYLSAQLGIDNVMDIQYRTFSSGINAPGRNFIVSLRGSL
jgi:hemoglobin/transferrin/lactoferrin receptor protein